MKVKVKTKLVDKYGQELMDGDVVDVQLADVHHIYTNIDGDLCFKPYGEEELVSDYLSKDLERHIL